MEHFYQDIEGWFDFEELYREAVRRMPADAPSRMVEVGVYKGRSCFFLAVEAKNSGKNIHVVAVDRFSWPATAAGDFSRLRREHGLTETVSMVQATSVGASRQFVDGSLDFVFLDADHEYDAVTADIAAWWPKIRHGGILAGHDFSDEYPGVQRAVTERFGLTQLASVTSGVRFIAPRSWWVDKL